MMSPASNFDAEMEELTDNFGRLNAPRPFDDMLHNRDLGGGAVWEVPDDEEGQTVPAEEDDDEPLDEEWELPEDGFDWGMYERAGKDGRLTADDILDSLLVSEVANNGTLANTVEIAD
jgi:hypothetical protein